MARSYYIKDGNDFHVTDSKNIDIHESIPAGTYMVMFHPLKGFYLSGIENMFIPEKIYGKTLNQAERIYHTFTQRPKNTGVLLNGEKGSGKTLMLSLLAHKIMKNGFPVIVVNSNFEETKDNGLTKFLSEIAQPCMVAFDEFDKTFETDKQAKILTLLDGVFNSTKLFVFTCNDVWRINNFMLNRPGRIFYNLSYKRLEEEAIRQYCLDNLDDKKEIDGVIALSSTIDAFNFDMLKALVEEMNRYKEPAKKSALMLNIRPERSRHITYKFLVSRNGKIFQNGVLDNDVDPLNGNTFTIWVDEAKSDDDEDNSYYLALSFHDMKRMDEKGYIFEKDGLTITIIKEERKSFSYDLEF